MPKFRFGLRSRIRLMWASEFDHHPHAAIDELLDLVLLFLGENAGRDDARVVQRFDVFERADDGLVLEVGLAVLQHRAARRPDPGHHVVLDAVRGFQRQRQHPAEQVLVGIGHLLRRRGEFRAVGRHLVDTGGLRDVEVDEDRVDERGEREHDALPVDLDDVGDLGAVIARFIHQRVERGDRPLLGKAIDPGAVEPDHVAQRPRGGADDDLVVRGG